MALNTRQTNFIGRLKAVCESIRELYGEAFNLRQSFQEEFSSGKDNDLEVMITELASVGLTYDALVGVCNQCFLGYTDFFEGNAVTTREYGRLARRIANNQ